LVWVKINEEKEQVQEKGRMIPKANVSCESYLQDQKPSMMYRTRGEIQKNAIMSLKNKSKRHYVTLFFRKIAKTSAFSKWYKD